jgi:hypothetical protein
MESRGPRDHENNGFGLGSVSASQSGVRVWLEYELYFQRGILAKRLFFGFGPGFYSHSYTHVYIHAHEHCP